MKYLIPILFIFLLVPMIALGFTNPLSPLNSACQGLTGEYSLRLCALLINIQWIIYGIGIILAAILIIIGGVNYVTAGDNEEKAKKARKMITNAIIGFAIVLAFAFITGMVREIIVNSLGG